MPVSRQSSTQIQLETTIQSTHALPKAGLIGEVTGLLAAFTTEVQPKIDRELTEVRSNLDRTLPNAEMWLIVGRRCEGDLASREWTMIGAASPSKVLL